MLSFGELNFNDSLSEKNQPYCFLTGFLTLPISMLQICFLQKV